MNWLLIVDIPDSEEVYLQRCDVSRIIVLYLEGWQVASSLSISSEAGVNDPPYRMIMIATLGGSVRWGVGDEHAARWGIVYRLMEGVRSCQVTYFTET